MANLKKWVSGPVPESDLNAMQDLFSNFDILRISVSGVSASDTYSTPHKSHLIYNFGTTDCYINFDAAATTGKLLIEAKTMKAIDGSFTALHAITAAGTTSVACLGLR